jgi:hypothetical protein
VVVKFSRVFGEPWTPANSASSTRIWQAPKYFQGYNPFDIDNVTFRQFDIMDFARPLRGRALCNLPRGLIFQDGRRLSRSATEQIWTDMRVAIGWTVPTRQSLPASLTGQGLA